MANKNKYNLGKWYGNKVFEDTVKYQKQYKFEMGTGKHATWNNESDAFKHTYMQAQLALWGGKHLAKSLGDYHEYQGNKYMGQSKGEENMDKWNNEKGRQIAREMIEQFGILSTIPSQKNNDIIAEKVMEKMRNGELITNPNDKREFKGFFENLDPGEISENGEIIRGSNDLPDKIIFAFLDGDLYQSIKTSLALVTPRLVYDADGRCCSVIIIHDYNNPQLPGVAKAVDEWMTQQKTAPRLQRRESLAIISWP